jgi:hypothetical protein
MFKVDRQFFPLFLSRSLSAAVTIFQNENPYFSWRARRGAQVDDAAVVAHKKSEH